MAVKKVPKWESKLWSYVCCGDGMRCPLYSHCQVRQRGDWCPDDNKEYLDRLVDCKRFNLSNYDFIGREARGGILQMVEMLARELLKKGRVHYLPVPTELVSLADEQHPIEVRLLPLKTHHGAIWHLRDRWIIQLRNDDTPATQRFTLFHEAFHILAHCSSNTIPVFRKIGTDEGGFNELLADFFAAFVLMPKVWVKTKWSEVHDLEQMSKIFDVPKPVMFIRLKRLGLI